MSQCRRQKTPQAKRGWPAYLRTASVEELAMHVFYRMLRPADWGVPNLPGCVDKLGSFLRDEHLREVQEMLFMSLCCTIAGFPSLAGTRSGLPGLLLFLFWEGFASAVFLPRTPLLRRCPVWLIWLKNRGRFLVDLVVQSTTRETHLFSQKGHLWPEGYVWRLSLELPSEDC